MDRSAFLRRAPLFRNVSDRALTALAETCAEKRFEKGAAIAHDETEMDFMLGIVSGQIKAAAQGPNGREMTALVLSDGDFFGEVPMLDGGAAIGDIVALTRVDALLIHRRDVLALFDREPGFARDVVTHLCARLRWLADLTYEITFFDLEARLANRLLALADRLGVTTKSGTEIAMRLSQQEMANMTASTREAVNKKLQEWRDADWIELGRNKLVIRDRTALEALIPEGPPFAGNADTRSFL